MIPVLGLIVGVLAGVFLPLNIPTAYSIYVAVAILAALDSVFGGAAAMLQNRFDIRTFLSGLFGNAFLAALLTYIGEKLGIQTHLAAIFAFGNRMFINFAIIRRILLQNYDKRRQAMGKHEAATAENVEKGG